MSIRGKLLPPTAILFDLDGTLVDSLPDLVRAASVICASRGLPPATESEVRRAIGQGARRLVDRLLDGPDPADLDLALDEFLDAYSSHPAQETRPFPGITRLLADVSKRQIPMAVVTNKPQDLAQLVVTDLGLDSFLPIVIGGRPGREIKPSPQPIQEALTLMSAPGESVWMVGDHETDLGAAERAGCTGVFCSWGYGSKGAHTPDLEVASVVALREALGLDGNESTSMFDT